MTATVAEPWLNDPVVDAAPQTATPAPQDAPWQNDPIVDAPTPAPAQAPQAAAPVTAPAEKSYGYLSPEASMQVGELRGTIRREDYTHRLRNGGSIPHAAQTTDDVVQLLSPVLDPNDPVRDKYLQALAVHTYRQQMRRGETPNVQSLISKARAYAEPVPKEWLEFNADPSKFTIDKGDIDPRRKNAPERFFDWLEEKGPVQQALLLPGEIGIGEMEAVKPLITFGMGLVGQGEAAKLANEGWQQRTEITNTFSGEVAKTLGGILPYYFTGGASKLATAGLMAAQGFTGTYEAAKAEGADNVRAVLAGGLGGITNVALVGIVGRLLKPFAPVLEKTIGQHVGDIGKEAGLFALLSVAQTASGSVIAGMLYDKQRGMLERVRDDLAAIVQSGGHGLAAGVALGVIQTILSRGQAKAALKAQNEIHGQAIKENAEFVPTPMYAEGEMSPEKAATVAAERARVAAMPSDVQKLMDTGIGEPQARKAVEDINELQRYEQAYALNAEPAKPLPKPPAPEAAVAPPVSEAPAAAPPAPLPVAGQPEAPVSAVEAKLGETQGEQAPAPAAAGKQAESIGYTLAKLEPAAAGAEGTAGGKAAPEPAPDAGKGETAQDTALKPSDAIAPDVKVERFGIERDEYGRVLTIVRIGDGRSRTFQVKPGETPQSLLADVLNDRAGTTLVMGDTLLASQPEVVGQRFNVPLLRRVLVGEKTTLGDLLLDPELRRLLASVLDIPVTLLEPNRRTTHFRGGGFGMAARPAETLENAGGFDPATKTIYLKPAESPSNSDLARTAHILLHEGAHATRKAKGRAGTTTAPSDYMAYESQVHEQSAEKFADYAWKLGAKAAKPIVDAISRRLSAPENLTSVGSVPWKSFVDTHLAERVLKPKEGEQGLSPWEIYQRRASEVVSTPTPPPPAAPGPGQAKPAETPKGSLEDRRARAAALTAEITAKAELAKAVAEQIHAAPDAATRKSSLGALTPEQQADVLDYAKAQSAGSGKGADKWKRTVKAVGEVIDQPLKDAAWKAAQKGATNPGFLGTPDAMPIIRYGARLISRGLTKFADWARAMIQHLGEIFRPHVFKTWEQVQVRVKAEPVAKEVAGAKAAPAEPRGPTSVKLAYTNQRRAELGLGERATPEPSRTADTLARAQAKVEANPNAARLLEEELRVKPRPAMEDDIALLSIRGNDLNNRLVAAESAMLEARKSGDSAAETVAKADVKNVTAELEKFFEVTEGTISHEASLALSARARFALMPDYSLAVQLRRIEVVEGRPPSPKEHAKAVKQAKELADYEKELTDAAARREEKWRKDIIKHTAELEAKHARGDFSKDPPKPERVLTPEDLELLTKYNHVKWQMDMARRPLGERLWTYFQEAGRLARSIAGGDISFSLRQLRPVLWHDIGNLVTGKPTADWARAVAKQVVAFGSEVRYQQMMAEIKNDPTSSYAWQVKFKLWTDMGELTKVSGREEMAPSRFAVKWIPPLKWGNRAAVVAGNVARELLYREIAPRWEARGMLKTEADHRALAKLIGDMTGRGVLPRGETLRVAAGLANDFLFSPRFTYSRIANTATLFHTLSTNPAMRAEGIKTLAGAMVMTAAVAAVAKQFGADTEPDPRSSDFLKVRTGNSRYDLIEGHGPVIRFIAQMATGQTKPGGGDGRIKDTDRGRVIWQFVQSKEAPLIGLISKLATGKTFFGQKIKGVEGWTEEAMNTFLFMWMNDAIDAFRDEYGRSGASAAAVGKGTVAGAASIAGEGVQTYPPKQNTSGGQRPQKPRELQRPQR